MQQRGGDGLRQWRRRRRRQTGPTMGIVCCSHGRRTAASLEDQDQREAARPSCARRDATTQHGGAARSSPLQHALLQSAARRPASPKLLQRQGPGKAADGGLWIVCASELKRELESQSSPSDRLLRPPQRSRAGSTAAAAGVGHGPVTAHAPRVAHTAVAGAQVEGGRERTRVSFCSTRGGLCVERKRPARAPVSRCGSPLLFITLARR
jgi:hypothetical protein